MQFKLRPPPGKPSPSDESDVEDELIDLTSPNQMRDVVVFVLSGIVCGRWGGERGGR